MLPNPCDSHSSFVDCPDRDPAAEPSCTLVEGAVRADMGGFREID